MNSKELQDDLENQLAKIRTKEVLSRMAELSRLESVLKEFPTVGEEVLMKEAEHYLRMVEGIHEILDRFDEQKD